MKKHAKAEAHVTSGLFRIHEGQEYTPVQLGMGKSFPFGKRPMTLLQKKYGQSMEVMEVNKNKKKQKTK